MKSTNDQKEQLFWQKERTQKEWKLLANIKDSPKKKNGENELS